MSSQTAPGLSPLPSRPQQHPSRPREHPAIAAYPQRRGFSSPLLSPRLSLALFCSVKVKLVSREPPLPIQPLPWHRAAATESGPRYGCCCLPGTSYAGLTVLEPRGFFFFFLPPGWARFSPAPSLERSPMSGGGAGAEHGTHPAADKARAAASVEPAGTQPPLLPWGSQAGSGETLPCVPGGRKPCSASPTWLQPPHFLLKIPRST